MESIKNLLRSVKTRLVITALVVIAIGVLFVLKPGTSGTWICYIVGAALCVSGVVRFITYFLGDFRKSFGSFDLVWGAALLLCGVYILVRPSLLYGLLTTAFAIFLVVDGVLKLQYAIDLYRMKAKGWWFVLAVALVMGVLGWSSIARLVYGSTLSVKEKEYVEASRALGASDKDILLRTILPNVVAPVWAALPMKVVRAILTAKDGKYSLTLTLSGTGYDYLTPVPALRPMPTRATGPQPKLSTAPSMARPAASIPTP